MPYVLIVQQKGHKYRVKFEVMGIDTPNLLGKASSILMSKISKIELKHCHSRQDRMYGSRILILGSVKKLWYVRNAKNPTPTWLKFQQLDSASEETATSSSQGKASRNQFLQSSSWLQNFQRFLKNPQYSSSQQQFQVAKLPVQWMPFPQYPLQCRMEILRLELLDNPGYPEEAPKGFHPQTFLFQKGRCCDMGQNDTIGKIELNPSFVLSSDNTNSKNDIQ